MLIGALSLVIEVWRGISSTLSRRSTFEAVSTTGKIKTMPGPRVPDRRPRRKTTRRSYSLMTRTEVKSSASRIRTATIPTQIAPVPRSSAILGSPLLMMQITGHPPPSYLFWRGKSTGCGFDTSALDSAAMNRIAGSIGIVTGLTMLVATPGLRPDGSQLHPAMPYLFYNGMADADLEALLNHLAGLTPIETPSQPPADLSGVALPPIPERVKENEATDESEQVAYGEYVVEHLMVCGACHTPRLETGEPDPARHLAGGMRFEGEWGTVYAM